MAYLGKRQILPSLGVSNRGSQTVPEPPSLVGDDVPVLAFKPRAIFTHGYMPICLKIYVIFPETDSGSKH